MIKKEDVPIILRCLSRPGGSPIYGTAWQRVLYIKYALICNVASEWEKDIRHSSFYVAVIMPLMEATRIG